jgi:hypothetical protein
MYNNRRSDSPTATLPAQAGYGPHPKRKAAARSGKNGPGPRKVPRRDSQSQKTKTVNADSSSDDDANVTVPPPRIGEGADSGFDDDEDSISQVEGANNADNKDAEERSHTGDEESGSEDFFNKVDKLRSTTTIATRGRVADSNLKLSLARQVQVASTVSKMHKPFIPLDFEAIRQGFLIGGVKSTDGNSTSSTSLNNNI